MTEGTKEWDELAHYLLASGNSDPAFDAVARNYFKGDETVGESALAKFRAEGGKFADLNEQEQLFLTELIAHETEVLFGSERMLRRIAKEKRSLAKRLLERIEDFFTLLKMSKEERKNFVKLEQARACLEKALFAAGDVETREIVDSDEGKLYNKSKQDGSVWSLLSKYEQRQLYERVDSMRYLGNHEKLLPNGNILLDIENKVIETDADIDRPSIKYIVEFNVYSRQLSKARDLFYEYINDGRTVREVVDLVNELCEEEVATLHLHGNSAYNSTVDRQGRNINSVGGSNRKSGNRGGSIKIDKRIVGFREIEEGVTEYTFADGTKEVISGKDVRKSKADAEFEKQTTGNQVKGKKKAKKKWTDFYTNFKETWDAESFFDDRASTEESKYEKLGLKDVLANREKSENAEKAPLRKHLSKEQMEKSQIRAEVSAMVDAVVSEFLDFGEDFGRLIGKGRQESAKRFFA